MSMREAATLETKNCITGGSANRHMTFGLQKYEESIEYVRKKPPAHYLLKIESFSLLKDKIATSDDGYFESSEFRAAGHRWVLAIYPKGNKKDGGDEHISIYSKLLGEKLDLGDSMNVMFKYFIYDHMRHDYYVIEVEKCLDAMISKGGLSKLITQCAFVDPSNGFLMNDRCAFGVEILLLESTITKFANVSYTHKPVIPTYTWKIYDFSKLGDIIFSPTFTTEGCSWKIALWPEGLYVGVSGKHIFNLHLDSVVGSVKKAFVEYEFCLKNQNKQEDSQSVLRARWFSIPADTWGEQPIRVPITLLNDPLKGFKVDDILIMEITIHSVLVLRET